MLVTSFVRLFGCGHGCGVGAGCGGYSHRTDKYLIAGLWERVNPFSQEKSIAFLRVDASPQTAKLFNGLVCVACSYFHLFC